MAKTVETAVKAARAKSLGRAKGDRENQAAHKHAGEEAAVAQAAVQEAHASAVLPKVAAADIAQEVGALSPEATLAGDFSFAGVMADAAASTAPGGAYAGMFSGGASAFAQDSGSTDSVGSGVSSGGVSIPLILGGLAAAAGVAAIVSSGGGDDNDSTPTPPPPPPPPANTAPTITSAATVAATEDTAAKFTVVATDKEGGALTYTAAGAKSGTVTGGENGAFTYTPNANFNGTDTVTITVKDSGGLTTTQTVTVNVASVNDLPTVTATQTVAGTEDTAAKFTVAATDADGGALTYTAAGAKSGTVTGGDNGAFTYTPNANFNGTDTVIVTVKDAAGATTTQTVTFNVAGVNDAPTFDADTTKTLTAINNGTAAAFSIKASDVDGDTLTPTITDQPDHGTLNGNTYVATKGFVGADAFTIQVSDGKGGLASQVVTVNVTAPPVTIVTVDKAGASSAAAGDTTFNVSAGPFVYTVDGFGAGDKIVSPAGNAGTLINSSFTDGQATIQYANSGVVTQIVLTGLTAAQDAQLFGTSDLNTVYGAGTFA